MEKLSARRKVTAIRLYLSGLSYDEIATKCGTSKGTVANIVAELKAGRFPEAVNVGEHIEFLRELSLDIKHSGLTPGQCAVGLAILKRINECGLDAADIERWPAILKAAGSEEGAQEFVDMVYRIQETQNKTGLTLEQADEKLRELEIKAAELEPALKQLQAYRQEIEEQRKTRDKLTPVVKNLEQKYALLDPRVKDLENRETGLLKRIKQEEARIEGTQVALAALSKAKQSFRKAGFSLEALSEFNDRARAIAARHHIAVSELRDRLLHELECLDVGLSLDALIQSRRAELQKHQQAVGSAKEERENIKATTVDLKQQKAALEGGIKATREKVSEEIATIVPLAKTMLGRFAAELQNGNTEMLDVVRRLKDQALEVGMEMGRYEDIVQTNQWLVDLLSVAQGKDGLEAKQVRAILLLILRGVQPWIKRNQAKAGFSTLPRTITALIRELEQLQV